MKARLAFTVVLLGLTGFAPFAAALDAGRHGPTYTIREPDFLEDIKRTVQGKVDSGEWNRLQDDMRKRATASLTDPRPVTGITTATRRRSWLFDPSVAMSRDILDSSGRVLFPAGTRVNPLDVVALPQPLMFFDGRDARQVETAQGVMKKFGGAVTPILVAGSWLRLGKAWQRQVYFDQEGRLVRQLGIHAVPALVTQEGRALRIEEFAP